MAVIQGRTRAQLRRSIGYNLGAVYVSSASGNSTATNEITDNTLIGADDNHNGKWVVFNDASGTAGQVTRVSDYTSSSTKLEVSPALAANPATSDSYELWDAEFNPAVIDDFLNQAIIESTGHAWDPVESLAFHTDGGTLRLDVPSGISMVRDLFYRNSVDFTRLHACATTFDEVSIPTGFTLSLDTKDKKQGTQSLKISLADGASPGAFIADSITATDISAYDTIEMWVKVTGISSALVAGNLKLHLDDGTVTADGNDKESLNIPAISPDTWTFARMSLGNPESDTAIASVGLEHDADLGAGVTIWIDDISVVKNDTARWIKLPRHLWWIDKEAKDVVMDSYVHGVARYNLLKLVGGDKPALLSADSDTSEISERYLIAAATARAFAANSGGQGTDPDQRRGQAGFWFGMANSAKRALPLLTNVRLVE
jgi:hypothetical protein